MHLMKNISRLKGKPKKLTREYLAETVKFSPLSMQKITLSEKLVMCSMAISSKLQRKAEEKLSWSWRWCDAQWEMKLGHLVANSFLESSSSDRR